MPDISLNHAIVETLRAARQVERELIGGLRKAVRDAASSPDEWSPKDHQAHLTAWRQRQLERFAAAHRGEEPRATTESVDELNAAFYAERAGRSWGEVESEADRITDALIGAVLETPGEALVGSDLLLGGSIGNGAGHTLEHLRWLADVHGRPDRVAEFADWLGGMMRRSFPPRDLGTFIYNQACFYALSGDLDEARRRLPEAFRLRPDLAEWALKDPDLQPLRRELPALAGLAE